MIDIEIPYERKNKYRVKPGSSFIDPHYEEVYLVVGGENDCYFLIRLDTNQFVERISKDMLVTVIEDEYEVKYRGELRFKPKEVEND